MLKMLFEENKIILKITKKSYYEWIEKQQQCWWSPGVFWTIETPFVISLKIPAYSQTFHHQHETRFEQKRVSGNLKVFQRCNGIFIYFYVLLRIHNENVLIANMRMVLLSITMWPKFAFKSFFRAFLLTLQFT